MIRRCVCGGAVGVALGFGWQSVSRKTEEPVVTVPAVASPLQLMRERAGLDPDSAWSVQLLGNEGNRVDMLYSLAEIDPTTDQLVARLLSLKEIDDWTLRNSARSALLAPLIENDPQGAMERCLTLGDVNLRRQVLSEIARRWAESDHEAVLAFLDAQKSDPLYDELLLSAVGGYGKGNPSEAIAIAIDRGMTKDLHRLGHLFKAYANTAPEEALKAAQALNADSLVNETMRAWASSDHESLLRYLDDGERGLKDSALRRAYEEIGKGWVGRDPQAAVDWVLTLTEANLSSDDLRSVLRITAGALTETHPDLALALLESPDLIANDYRYVYASYGAKDWDGAMASLQDLEGAQKQHAVRGLLANLEGRSKDEILTHLPTLLEMLGSAKAQSHDVLQKLDGETMLALVKQYPMALEDAAEGWARSNRLDSVAVIEQLPEGKARSGAVQELIVDWAGNEPEKAAVWVAGRPDSTESRLAIRNLVNVWGRQDPASAEAWLATQPPSKVRDAGWQELAQLRVGFDPLASLGMSAQITDEARRHKMAAVALEGLLWQDPETAERKIEELALPKAIREQLDRRAEEFASWKRLAAGEDE